MKVQRLKTGMKIQQVKKKKEKKNRKFHVDENFLATGSMTVVSLPIKRYTTKKKNVQFGEKN